MPKNESLYPADWLRIAQKDFARVVPLLDRHDPELAGFCLQQAVEKYLKAFLLSRGWQLRRIHNLDTLLDDAVVHDASLEDFRSACQKITAFHFMERYPLVAEAEITEQDVRSSLAEVTALIEKLEAEVAEK